MSSNKYKPTISRQGYDAIEGALWAELKGKYDASKADSEKPPPNPATKGAFDHVPDLDSKTVARWSPTITKYLGCKLDPDLIRKGGYDSFDDFRKEMSPKLRETCSDGAASASAGAAAQGATP